MAVPLFNNPPIEPENFQPWKFNILNIVPNGQRTIVFVDVPAITHLNYVVGQQVRLLIPVQFGCRQLNQKTAYVVRVTPPNRIALDIDSRGQDRFIPATARTPAQIVAIGDNNSGIISSTGQNIPLVTIPGSFINISPN